MKEKHENVTENNGSPEGSLPTGAHRAVDPGLIEKVTSFIEKFYIDEIVCCEELDPEIGSASDKSTAPMMIMCEMAAPVRPRSCAPKSLRGIFDDMDKGFAETLFYYIDKKGITDVEAYKLSNVDKKTFSKIKCNTNYRPSKITAVSFAIGLHLSIRETNHLLRTAGMCLSRSNKFDVIIEYFITSGDYKTIFDVNDVLYEFDQSTLGTLE
ncbi:MAG: hypothetical protein IKC61_01065 [Clostridia bacterium]|nr:hypothetical protein [Clostridia bacterium]